LAREPEHPEPTQGAAGAGHSTEFLEDVFELSPQAIVVTDATRLLVANRAVEELTGRPRAELVGRPITELIQPQDAERVGALNARRVGGERIGTPTRFRILDSSGDVRWLEATSVSIPWRGGEALLSYLADITALLDTRAESEELSRRLERITQLSPYFVFVYDYELGRDVFINRPVPEALGFSSEEAKALEPYPFDKLCHPEDHQKALERDVRWKDIPDGAVDAVEFRMRNRDGEWRWFRSLNTPFQRDDEGRVRQMLGVCIDVTDAKRSEEARSRSDKLESLGLLAGGLAHDFGNLLTPMMGHAELLLDKLGAESPLLRHAEAIRTAAERATELISQLLVVSGRGEFEPRPVALEELVLEIIAMVGSLLPPEVRLETELATPLPPVAGDPTQLRQVVLNLIQNAGEALEGTGGTIVVRALKVEIDETLASVLELRERVEHGPAVLLEVEDDGPGMDETTRSRLLEPFFTTKPKGKGWGLASVGGIVRRHRGGLAVDSNPGRGTIFRILLPLAGTPVSARS